MRSAAKAFERVAGGAVQVTNDAKDLEDASHIVLPGVGAFGDCVSGLKQIPGMIGAIEKQVLGNKKPFLGICVGMQLLADTGYEHGTHKGLGWIGGEVVKIQPVNNLPVPHMGWNGLEVARQNPLLAGIKSDFYFVHSYQFNPLSSADVLATVNYGGAITAAVQGITSGACSSTPKKASLRG